MPYKGEDLDLRTPSGWGPIGQPPGSEPNWATRTTIYQGGRANPIWVDDNVLACCNHAFDLAIAHRSSEVRLEHLINAMTTNDAIARELEIRGIGVGQLRRESGLILASESPAGPVNGKLQPRRSEALEETLRLAADRAYPRRTPVTIDDILHVLFDMKRDLPGLQLLRRHSAPHSAQWAGRNGSHRSDARIDARFESRPSYVAPDDPRPRFTPPPPSRDREPAGSQIDSLQNNRIDALDRTVRDLGLDLADDRKLLQSIVTELQRQSAAQAEDASRFRGGLGERLSALEDALLRNRPESAQLPQAIYERMAAIERTIDARFAELARNQPGTTALADRMAVIERTLDQRIGEIGRGWIAVGERLQKLDVLDRTFATILDRLAGLERQLGGMQTKIADLAPETYVRRWSDR